MYMPYLSVLPHHKDFDVARAQEDHFDRKEDFSWASLYNPYSANYSFSPAVASHFQASISVTIIKAKKADVLVRSPRASGN
jgi:hypothetical protein